MSRPAGKSHVNGLLFTIEMGSSGAFRCQRLRVAIQEVGLRTGSQAA